MNQNNEKKILSIHGLGFTFSFISMIVCCKIGVDIPILLSGALSFGFIISACFFCIIYKMKKNLNRALLTTGIILSTLLLVINIGAYMEPHRGIAQIVDMIWIIFSAGCIFACLLNLLIHKDS